MLSIIGAYGGKSQRAPERNILLDRRALAELVAQSDLTMELPNRYEWDWESSHKSTISLGSSMVTVSAPYLRVSPEEFIACDWGKYTRGGLVQHFQQKGLWHGRGPTTGLLQDTTNMPYELPWEAESARTSLEYLKDLYRETLYLVSVYCLVAYVRSQADNVKQGNQRIQDPFNLSKKVQWQEDQLRLGLPTLVSAE